MLGPRALIIAIPWLLVLGCRSPEGTVRGEASYFDVSPLAVQLVRHDTIRLHTTVLNDNMEVLTGVPVTYTSHNTAVATVDVFGLVRSPGLLGSTTITVAVPGVTFQRDVAVTIVGVPAQFSLAPTDTSLQQGDSVQLRTTLLDTAGIPIPGASIAFSSTGPIGVTQSGLVISSGPGDGTVTATYQSLFATAYVHVIDSALAGRVTAFGRPLAVAVSRTGTALVTRTLAVFLTRINLPAIAASQIRVPVGLTDVTFDTTGGRAYALDPAGKVDIVDVGLSQLVDSFSVAGVPEAVAVSADNQFLFVATDVDTLYRYTRSTATRVGAFPLPGRVASLIRHPSNGNLLYIALPDSSMVVEYDIPGDSVRRRLLLGGSPSRLAIAPDGTELFAGDAAAKAVHVWDLPANTDLTSIPLGAAPSGVGITPDGTHLWVSLQTLGLLLELDRASRTVLRTINVRGAPRGLGVSPVDGSVVVSNDSGWVDVAK